MNNIGLLVRVWGQVISVDPEGKSFIIDDGSGIGVKCVLPAGATLNPGWSHVQVTGASSCELSGSLIQPVVMVRAQEDITGQ